MTCSRPNCGRKGARGKRGLCDAHYRRTRHGYVDSGPVLEHLRRLRNAGLSQRKIAELTGLHRDTIRNIGAWTDAARVEIATSDAILGVPVPRKVLAKGGGMVPAAGTRRRVQALMLAGWTASYLGAELGVSSRALMCHIVRDRKQVHARTAAEVEALCDRLWDKRGPSVHTASRARKAGWLPLIMWDDIDDPDEVPVMPEDKHVLFPDRVAELEYLHVPRSRMAEMLGIQPDSFERQIYRYSLQEAV